MTDVENKTRSQKVFHSFYVLQVMARVSDPVFLLGSESGFQISLDSDPSHKSMFKSYLLGKNLQNYD